MIHLTINQKPVAVPEGTTILEAARSAGIEIPSLCYLKNVHRFGSCRICVVEVEGMRTLQASLHDQGARGHGGAHPTARGCAPAARCSTS